MGRLEQRKDRLQSVAALKKAELGILPVESKSSEVLLEQLARLEHQQWCDFASAVLEGEPGLSKERSDRWKRFLTSYDSLPDPVKNICRGYAKKSLDVVLARLHE